MLFHWQDNCCRWIVKCSATGPILFRRIGTWRRKDTWKPSLAPLKLGFSIVCALDNDVHITRLIYRIVTAETKPNVRSMAGSKNRFRQKLQSWNLRWNVSTWIKWKVPKCFYNDQSYRRRSMKRRPIDGRWRAPHLHFWVPVDRMKHSAANSRKNDASWRHLPVKIAVLWLVEWTWMLDGVF